MGKAKIPRPYFVAVYRSEEGGRVTWAGYTRWFNAEWNGYQGMFEVLATCHRDAVRTAIKIAKAAHQESPDA